MVSQMELILFPGFRLGLHPPHFSFRCALQLAWSHLCWCHFFRRDSAFLQLLLAACQDAEALDVPLIFTVLQPVLPQDLLVLDFASFTGYYPFAATASCPSSCAPALCRHGVIGFWSYGYVLPAGAPTEPSPYLQSEILRRAGCGNPARHSTRITVRAWIAKVANLKFLLEEGDVDGALQIARSLEDAMGETLNDLSNEGNEGGRIRFLFLVLDVQSFGSSILPFRPSSSLVPS